MLSNLSTSLSRTTVRNALYALGHVEALRDRARFEGGGSALREHALRGGPVQARRA